MGIIGVKYLIEKSPGHYVIGQKSDVLTKGNDDEYPTFELEDGSLLGAHISKVKELNDESE